jgi:hypothetical protein
MTKRPEPKEVDVLRRMLNTPPAPVTPKKNKPKKAKKADK